MREILKSQAFRDDHRYCPKNCVGVGLGCIYFNLERELPVSWSDIFRETYPNETELLEFYSEAWDRYARTNKAEILQNEELVGLKRRRWNSRWPYV